MISTAQALYQFFAGFGIPAYTVDSVPDGATTPYITYSVSEPEWDRQASGYVQVWDRSKSNLFIFSKGDEIVGAIGEGVRLDCTGGYVVIWPQTPLMQLMVDGDIRSAYINISINAYHMPGI